MNKKTLDIYNKLLFSDNLKTYTIVDSLRDDSIQKKMFEIELQYCSLWHQEIEESTMDVPLYLVELKSEDEFLTYLLENHEKGLATYFQSPYDLKTLQNYYSTFTYPKIETQKDKFQKGVFGFYDPTILPNYLETLYTQEKIDEFFARITLWLTPSLEDKLLAHLAFRTKQGTVENITLKLENFLNEENVTLNYNNISTPIMDNLERYVQERVIDYRQIKIFDKIEIEKFVDLVFLEFKANNEVLMKDEATLKSLAMSQFYTQGKALGLESEAGLYYFILFCCLDSKHVEDTEIKEKVYQFEEEFQKVKFLQKQIQHYKIQGDKDEIK